MNKNLSRERWHSNHKWDKRKEFQGGHTIHTHKVLLVMNTILPTSQTPTPVPHAQNKPPVPSLSPHKYTPTPSYFPPPTHITPPCSMPLPSQTPKANPSFSLSPTTQEPPPSTHHTTSTSWCSHSPSPSLTNPPFLLSTFEASSILMSLNEDTRLGSPIVLGLVVQTMQQKVFPTLAHHPKIEFLDKKEEDQEEDINKQR